MMPYKILNDLVQVNHSDLVYNSSVTHGHSLRLLHLPTRVDVYSYSFFPSSIRIWNKLPEDVVISPSLDLNCNGNDCCSILGAPWFCRSFTEPEKEGVEVRICRDEVYSNESATLLEQVQLHVHSVVNLQ